MMMIINKIFKWAIYLSFISLQHVVGQSKIPEHILGIYGSPAPLWQAGYQLSDLGVNAIFVRSHSIDSTMSARAKGEGLLIFAEFPTLNGKNYVNDHPEAWAINEKGEKVESASWFMGVCPTDPGFRKYRETQLHELLQQNPIDGVWLDYVHWHAQFEEEEPILPETCFCEHCTSAFASAYSKKLPPGPPAQKAKIILSEHEDDWRKWRCEVILDWVTDLKSIMQNYNPNGLLGIYHCPWRDEEFDGARRKILGLDYDMLRSEVDVFSPMVYHQRMHRSEEWVEKNLEWHAQRLKISSNGFPKLWPIVQAHDVSASSFAQVLRAGLKPPASGVMMFTSNSIAEDPEKRTIMQKIFTNRSNQK